MLFVCCLQYVYPRSDEFRAAPEVSHQPSAAGRPLSYFQRRLHCRVALSAAHRLSPVRDDVPNRHVAATARTTDSEDVIVVGSGWTTDAKRAATKLQPKLEPGVQQPSTKSYSSATTVNQPRQDMLTARHRDGSSSHRVEPSRAVTLALMPAFNHDQMTSAPRAQQLTLSNPTTENNNTATEQIVKRGRGRPRKYPPKSTVVHTAQTTSTTNKLPRPRSKMQDRLVCDKENVSPLSSAVRLDRNIWTSSAVRNVTSTSKPLRASDLTTNKLVEPCLVERHKLAELPVNVVLSDDNNNFQKKPPAEKASPNFRLKDLDKDKLLSVWNALKGTLQSDDWDAISRRDRADDAIRCKTAEQRRSTLTDKRQVDSHTTEHATKPNGAFPIPGFDAAAPPSDTEIALRQHAAKTVHWKCPETNDVGRVDNKLSGGEFLDEPIPVASSPFVEDFDETLPLSSSLGKPLFTSTPIKLTDAAVTSTCGAAPGRVRRARVRFRAPTRQSSNHDDDEEDVGDRVELSKLASMQHGATQMSGVRPADIVRAFRTIDNVAAAAATSTLALQSHHGLPAALPFAVPPSVRAPTSVYQPAPPLVDRGSVNVDVQPVVKESSSPATTVSDDTSPLPNELVPGQLLQFYGAYHDAPPYNLSPSTGVFVTKAARKRPIADDDRDAAPDRKRFQPDVPTTTGVNTGHVTGDVSTARVSTTCMRQSDVTAEPPQSRPEVSRTFTTTTSSQCRAAPEVTSRDPGMRRAANGVPVDDLLRLQRKLSTASDAATLRRVVQIIGETGRYCVNDVTFDFDLCNLDSATVARLIQCLDTPAAASQQ